MGTSEILLLHDGNGMVGGVEEALARVVPVRRVNMLDAFQSGDGASTGAVVCVNHSTIKNFDMLARTFDVSTDRSVFVMPRFSAEYASALRDLGVGKHLVAPVDSAERVAAVSVMRNRLIESGWNKLPQRTGEALVTSRSSFKKAFDGIRGDGHLDLCDIARTCALIADSTKVSTLSD